MVASKKPLVGHNLTFDLLFLLRWLGGPLPATMAEFCGSVAAQFPTVFDTKFVAQEGYLCGMRGWREGVCAD